MSTDTTVVLVHGTHKARCTLPILVGLLTLAAPLVGQARHGHFYHARQLLDRISRMRGPHREP